MATAVLQKRNYAKSVRTYMVLILVTVLLAGFYGYTQYLKLSGAQDALAKEQAQITDLQTVQGQTSTDLTNLKADFDQKYAGILDSLEAVYPSGQDYTKLTAALDAFFLGNNSSFNPVFVSDLKFGQPRNDASVDYAVLPVTMTITGTQDNFNKFLQYAQNSGVLTGNLKDSNRLIDIRSISINFNSSNNQNSTPTVSGVATQGQQMINVSVTLNAYFQKPFAAPVASATKPAATPTK